MLGDLGVSTLRIDQDHDSVFFSFLSIKPAMLPASMLGDCITRVSATPSCFLRHTDLLGNLFLITSLLDLLSLLFLFWIIILAILSATMHQCSVLLPPFFRLGSIKEVLMIKLENTNGTAIVGIPTQPN
jgi:hypothetical protein